MNITNLTGTVDHMGGLFEGSAEELECIARPMNLSKATDEEKQDAQTLLAAAQVLRKLSKKAYEYSSTVRGQRVEGQS